MKTLSAPTKEHTAQGDYYVLDGDTKYAGIHLLAELWHARYLRDATKIRKILINSIEACGATMLSIDLHTFSPNGGVSGVAVLQESHISIHTWPEFEYAAVDIFVCGKIKPHSAVEILEAEFQPKRMELTEIKRGILT
ncbi:MAG: adenosylmethionine decarboxylase [Desulfatiglans sp.]|jgi:S-adenosylmethionine decarboxylase|nr:adenosylmethionine decarboxylase [Thermodesulfobacteriota bacterium]MEE4354222.1 adenosylmethionine decarboxylase [Desulfatiglans sp.]